MSSDPSRTPRSFYTLSEKLKEKICRDREFCIAAIEQTTPEGLDIFDRNNQKSVADIYYGWNMYKRFLKERPSK